MESEPINEPIKWEHLYIPIYSITPVDNIRPIDPEVVEEIASSIPVNGQLQACIADTTPDGVRLLAGRHRYEAIKLLNERGYYVDILVRLADRELSDEEILSIQMSENLHNKMTSAQEAAIIYSFWNKMIDIYNRENVTISMIATRMGRSPRKVSDAVKYVENLSPLVQEMVNSGKLAYSSALLLTGLTTTNDGWGEQTRIAVQIISRNLNSKDAKKYIQKLKQENEFTGPLFGEDIWENLKQNGHIISIKTQADREGRKAAGWFVRILGTISMLEEPDKVELSNGIINGISSLGMSLNEFIKKISIYNPKYQRIIEYHIQELIDATK